MRKLITICTLFIATYAVSQNNSNRVVSYPIIESTNTTIPVISKIEITDTATRIDFKVYFRPKYWIKIGSDSRIQIGEKRYDVIKGEGIELDEQFWMPQSGRAEYTLIYPPLPKETKSFDYIGGDCERCWKLYNVDLTGKKEIPLYPKGLPFEYRNQPKDGPLPDFQYSIGTSKIKIHLLGYRKEMKLKLHCFGASFFIDNIDLDEINIQDDGTALLEFQHYGASNILLLLDRASGGQRMYVGNLWIAPGEHITAYINMQALARTANLSDQPNTKIRNTIYTHGKYAHLNNLLNSDRIRKTYSLNLRSGKFADYKMTADQYINHTLEQYDSVLFQIKADSLPQMIHEYYLNTLRQELLLAAANAPFYLLHNYKAVFNKWNPSDSIEYQAPRFDSKHFEPIRNRIEFNTPSLPMGHEISLIKYDLECPMQWLTNTKKGMLLELKPALELIEKSNKYELTDDDLNRLKSFDTPIFLQIAQSIINNNRVALSKLNDSNSPIDVADIKEDKVLEYILSRHKGKVILIDMWNTWCPPCTQSIKNTEPYKSKELKSDELVWVYIADETSPQVKYLSSIPNIKGEHYRLSRKQSDFIAHKFGITTIPSYILVDKTGKAELRKDFDNHNTMIQTLKDMIQK